MYVEAFEEQVYHKLEDTLGHEFEVKLGAGDLQSEESIKALANRVDVKPHLLINIGGSAEPADSDTTNRASRDSVLVEILVCVSDARSRERQRREALKYVFGTRYTLQGYKLTSDYTAGAPLAFAGFTEEFNIDGFCVYSVQFTVETLVDLDEFEI